MADKYTAANDYTDSEMLAILREAMLRAWVSGQSYQVNIGGGTRTFVMPPIEQARLTIDWLENRIAADSGQSRTNYARMTRG